MSSSIVSDSRFQIELVDESRLLKIGSSKPRGKNNIELAFAESCEKGVLGRDRGPSRLLI